MTASVVRPGVGALTPRPAPDGLRMWTVDQPPVSTLYGVPVEAHILLAGADGLDGADLPLIAEVLAGVDGVLLAALRFVHDALRDDPGFFGLTPARAAPPLAAGPTGLPLESPQFTFHDDGWLLRFEGRLPVCDPYGLAVLFEGTRPVGLEDLSEAEMIDPD
ncbi:hypothetical protein AB0D49_07030 [Streptomyces sp. NPDC048290]|uniref:hypothetical protein n=1 Tax=Streptomyces sp. NPDC048290 TaxID=3155811 RepID=UPI00343C8969